MKSIFTVLVVLLIGTLISYGLRLRLSGVNTGYTSPYKEVLSDIGSGIRAETSESMESAGALQNPRSNIAPSPGDISKPTPGTTTTQPNFPAWVKREELSADKYCWHASPHGAPKTPTWAKWGLRPTIDGKGVVALTLPGGKNYRVIFMPGEKTMLQEGGKDPRCPNTAELVSIFADATEVGFEPYNGEPLSARITFSTKE